jgi:hypothetical protein
MKGNRDYTKFIIYTSFTLSSHYQLVIKIWEGTRLWERRSGIGIYSGKRQQRRDYSVKVTFTCSCATEGREVRLWGIRSERDLLVHYVYISAQPLHLIE